MQQYDGQNVGVSARLLNAFYRYRWLFLLSVCVVVAVTTVADKLRKGTYKATAQTQVVSDQQLRSATLGENPGYVTISSAQENVNHLNDMMGDDGPNGFVDSALKSAQLDRPINVDPRADDPRLGLLRKRLVVAAESDSLFTISLVWDNPRECERIVEALQKQYIEETGINQQATSIATMKFLESEMDRDEAKMKEAEQALIDYKKVNAGNLPDSQANDIQQLAQLKVQRDTLTVAAQDSALKLHALQDRMTQIHPMSVLSRTLTDSPEALQIKVLQGRRAVLIAEKNMPSGDAISFIDKQIADLQVAIKSASEVGQLPGTVVTTTDMHDNPEYMALDRDIMLAKIADKTQSAQLALLNSQIATYEARAEKIPAEQKILNDKTRGYVFYKTQYDSLVERREQALLKANLDKISARSTLVQVGTIYAEPTTTGSKRMIMLAAGVVGGLLVGFVVVLYGEWSDQTIRYGADVERLLGLPLLSEVSETSPVPGSHGDLSFRVHQRGRS